MVEMKTLTIETPEGEAITYKVIDARLPEVSSSDNGKLLRVVDGAWAVASIADAEGVSF